VSPAQIGLLLAAAFGAGVMNSMAGGGTLLTFPALLLAGLPPIAANATSTVALVPGSLAGALGFRQELRDHGAALRRLAAPSLLGGVLGSVLLLATPEKAFLQLVPWLVLFATVLLTVQPLVPGLHGRRTGPFASIGLQLAIAVYGGYFGAGMGILMLALLGVLGIDDIHARNGVKNVLGALINGTAALWFAFSGAADLPLALVMMAGSIAGGWAGARLAQAIGREGARRAAIGIGVLVSLLLFRR
jgi:uncharacterized membrane protein YfcA